MSTRRGWWTPYLAVFALTLLSSWIPSVAQAGAWTLEEGRVWSKAAFLYLRSDTLFADQNDERFGLTGCVDGAGSPVSVSAGDRRPYDCTTGGTFQVAAIYLDAYFGIIDELDLTLQIPAILHAQFHNESGLRGSDAGLGDIRLGAQYRFLADPVVLAASFVVKAPTGSFTTNEAVPPLGEGQWDLTYKALIGRSFGRVYLGADAGYRVRLTNPQTRINVGDEILVNVEGGGNIVHWLTAIATVDLLWGFESEEAGAPTNRPRRWVLHGSGKLLFALGAHVGVELSLRWPIAGEGWPADPVFGLAVFGKTPRLWTIRGE